MTSCHLKSVFLSAVLLLAAPLAARAETYTLDDIRVEGRAVRLPDQVDAAPLSVSLEQPAGNVDLSQSLQKLPGVAVRNVSGTGSLVTAYPATAVNAGTTQTSIDDIPVINPLGTGVNYSLFPAPLIEALELRLAGDSAFVPFHDPRPAPGGRINLRTLKPRGRSPFIGTLGAGSASTFQGSAAYTRKGTASEQLIGASGTVAEGDYRFRDISTNKVENRTHNHSAGYGILGKSNWDISSNTRASALIIGQELNKALPGSVASPEYQHQKDRFILAGAAIQSPRAFGKIAGSHTRNSAYSEPAAGSTAATFATDDRVSVAFAQGGYTLGKLDRLTLTGVIDNEHTRYRANTGKFFRNVFGMTVQGFYRPRGFPSLTVAPLMRQDVSSQYSGARDYRLALIQNFTQNISATLTLAYDHLYPAVTAETGYLSSFGLVRANPSLGVERHQILQASLVKTGGSYQLWFLGWVDRAFNRATLDFGADGTFQHVALPRSRIMGVTADAVVSPNNSITFRTSATVQQPIDLRTNLDLPFKPRLQGLVSVGFRIFESTILTAEETYLGPRRYAGTSDAARGTPKLKPFNSTNLRLDTELTRWKDTPVIVFARMTNIFQKAGEDFPGYPLAGRTFFVGITLNESSL